MPEARLEQLQKYIDREKLMTKADKGVFFSSLEAASKTAAALWLWVLAIDVYTKCFKLYSPPLALHVQLRPRLMSPCVGGRPDCEPAPTLSRAYYQLPLSLQHAQRSVAVQFPSLHHFELAEEEVGALCAEQAAASAARLDASITAMPAHANFVGRKAVAEPRLNPAQIGSCRRSC